jgi:hypothetical protein
MITNTVLSAMVVAAVMWAFNRAHAGDADTSRINADTSRINADTSRINADTARRG